MKIDYFIRLFLVSAILFILYLTIRALYFGAFAFWFDPARDLGLGLANLKKISLIGHPSGGLPGLFYGPYYIWMISLAEVVSRDPRWVWFAVATIPYFTLFPLILYTYRKYADVTVLLAFWLIFLLSFNNHSQIWNPNPTPIMYLAAVYFGSRILFKTHANVFFALYTGLAAGLIANYHMSYGVGIILSFLLLFIINFLIPFFKRAKGKNIRFADTLVPLILYVVGTGVTYVPFLLFELRHGFNQIKILLANFQLGLTKGTSLNLGQGFSKTGIIDYFFIQGAKLLHIPSNLIWIFLIGCFIFILVRAYKSKKKPFTDDEKRLLFIVSANAAVVLFVFITAKNPVYDYFFIGVEMFFLLVALVITRKIPFFKWFFLCMVVFLLVSRVQSEVQSLGKKNTSSNYESKRKTVELIYKDIKKPPFTVYVYDPAIYTFDYDYIFGMYQEKYGFAPNRQQSPDKTVYVVLPESKNQGSLKSFAEYHTPVTEYMTKGRWTMDDGTVILRRERIK